jgi:hypothetical protein
VPRWVPTADLGISRWAVVALAAAMIAVGAMGLVLRGSLSQQSTPGHTPPASTAAADSH